MMQSFTQVAAALFLLASAASAKEMAVDEVKAKELYDSGIIHNEIMQAKMVVTLNIHDWKGCDD